MLFAPVEFLDENTTIFPADHETIPGDNWIRVNEHTCTFESSHFLEVALNLIKNPNINSSLLFRADIFYDSHSNELVDAEPFGNTVEELKNWYQNAYNHVDGLRISRRIIRQLVPRNPQLDRPVAQTCFLLESEEGRSSKDVIVLLLPHVSTVDDLPWYHPAVRALAYWYQSPFPPTENEPSTQNGKKHAVISVHYQLFPDQQLPLSKRILRTAANLLQVLHKHGQGTSIGYRKQSKHDQLIAQKRVQDTYSELKAKHATRLCSAWVEQTEPSKHVFEDLGIAAYLIELWKDMYATPGESSSRDGTSLPPFPGFVDIGCGNGVLTEVLLLSGYPGQGFDGRRRKTWSILSPKAQAHLHETLCVPQPLFDLYPASPAQSKLSLLARARALLQSSDRPLNSSLEPPKNPWHNGLFSTGTFIISNHADELTAWTPLLACLTASPFLAIPCCSHNLSGARFRAPSVVNAHTADSAAPSYFNAQKPQKPTKSIPIMIPTELEDNCDSLSTGTHSANGEKAKSQAAETGDLRTLAPAQRSKQPSAYASLCDWVAHIAEEAGYVVERDQLRIPSTRDMGLIGRAWRPEAAAAMQGRTDSKPEPEAEARVRSRPGAEAKGSSVKPEGSSSINNARNHDAPPSERADGVEARSRAVAIAGAADSRTAAAARKERVARIVQAEGGDGVAWVRRCNEVLAKGGGVVHGRE
jgi:tRNASer (uridine44-2'-O)-methyltransferase